MRLLSRGSSDSSSDQAIGAGLKQTTTSSPGHTKAGRLEGCCSGHGCSLRVHPAARHCTCSPSAERWTTLSFVSPKQTLQELPSWFSKYLSFIKSKYSPMASHTLWNQKLLSTLVKLDIKLYKLY
eukprot:scaffold32807_cov18-Tisochrysis_lutea.AAC.3